MDKLAQWMGGACVESKWGLGGDITFTGEAPNFNKTYHDRSWRKRRRIGY